MREVFIIGAGMTRFAKHKELSVKDLAREAVEKTLADAGLDRKRLQAVWFSNSTWGYYSSQLCIRGEVALRPLGITGLPVVNVENACAGGATALNQAWLGVASGLYDCVMALGAEKIYNEDKAKMFAGFFAGIDVENMENQIKAWLEILARLQTGPVQDQGQGTGRDRSVFMDIYAAGCRWHMEKYGTTPRQLAVVASKNHFHGSLNPQAQYRENLSVDEVLAGRPVSWPLTVPMCAPVGDGGAAAILCSKDFLKRLPGARPVRILASVLGSGTDRGIDQEDLDIAARVSRLAYELAGLGPQDIDLAEVHDATAFGELHMSEALGFCPLGKGGPLAESGATRLGGRRPINTSGGLESRGHPIGASGLGQVHELVTQLRHEAGSRQVAGCRLALAENGGGNLGFEEAALGVHILERVD
jgi:acetyl-CoA acetyltransferase